MARPKDRAATLQRHQGGPRGRQQFGHQRDAADNGEFEGDIKEEQADQCPQFRPAEPGQGQGCQRIDRQPEGDGAQFAQPVNKGGHQALGAHFGDADHGRGSPQGGNLEAEGILQPDAEDQVDLFVGGAWQASRRPGRPGRAGRSVPAENCHAQRCALAGGSSFGSIQKRPATINHAQQGQKRERRHPAFAGDQETHQRDSHHKGQRPAELGDGNASGRAVHTGRGRRCRPACPGRRCTCRGLPGPARW